MPKRSMLKKILVRSAPATRRALVNAYNEECFYVHNGPTLSNLKELLHAFKYMSQEQYLHHVTHDKNDFALWVERVLEDPECARSLEKTKTLKKAAVVVEERLEDYRT